MARGRVFILESPNPLELVANLGERLTLEQVCRVMGYEGFTFLVRDVSEFCQTCGYIGSTCEHKKEHAPLFLHLSFHGDEGGAGICIGNGLIKWSELADTIERMCRRMDYSGPIILIISACAGNRQRLTAELQKRARSGQFMRPEFVFVFAHDEVDWRDAVVTWTVFYRNTTQVDFANKARVMTMLKRLHGSRLAHLKYFRWDRSKRKYISYNPAGS